MVVIVILSSGAILAIMTYTSLKERDPDALEEALFRIKQQAGLLGVFCSAVFAAITALQSAKLVGLPSVSSVAASVTPPSGTWGKRAAEIITA